MLSNRRTNNMSSTTKHMSFAEAQAIMLPFMLTHFQFKQHNGVLYMKCKDGWKVFTEKVSKLDPIFIEVIHIDDKEHVEQKEAIGLVRNSASHFTKFRKSLRAYAMERTPDKVYHQGDEPESTVEYDDLYVEEIMTRILLPEGEVLQKIAEELPVILTNERLATEIYTICHMTCLAYVLFTLRSQVCDEFHSKKSIPINKKGGFKPVNPLDGDHYKEHIYLGKKSYTSLTGEQGVIRWSTETALFYLIRSLTHDNNVPNLVRATDHIIDLIYDRSDKGTIYRSDWKSELPVLLSDSTNVLTVSDKHVLKQFPIWTNRILEKVDANLIHIGAICSNGFFNDRTNIMKEKANIRKIISNYPFML